MNQFFFLVSAFGLFRANKKKLTKLRDPKTFINSKNSTEAEVSKEEKIEEYTSVPFSAFS